MKKFGILMIASVIGMFLVSCESRDARMARTMAELRNAYNDSIAKVEANKQIEKENIIKTRTNAETASKLSNLFKHDKDEFSNKEWISLKSVPSGVANNKIYAYFTLENGKPTGIFRFVVNYFDEDWLFIKNMIFNIDGENVTILPDNVQSDVLYGGNIYEKCDNLVRNSTDEKYIINEELIKKIANAKSVKIKLNGSQYYDTRTMTTAQIKGIKDTYDYFCALGGYID